MLTITCSAEEDDEVVEAFDEWILWKGFYEPRTLNGDFRDDNIEISTFFLEKSTFLFLE